jgi:Tfp pilus assembly protein FimT
MTKKAQAVGSQRGYSAVELMMTLGVAATVSAMAAFQIGVSRPGFKGDGAMRVVLAQLNTARELALTQRRAIQIQFNNTNQIQLTRQEVAVGGTTPPPTLLTTVSIEGGITYNLTAGLPDTPDGFGNATPVAFGAATQMVFSTDGTLENQLGAPISGTVFISIPGLPLSSRAITILGATGRIRGYKWDGSHWVRA